MERSYERPRKRKNPSGKVMWRAPVVNPRTGKREWAGTFKTEKLAYAAQDSYYAGFKVGLEEETVESYFDRWTEEHPRPCDQTNRDAKYRISHYVLPVLGGERMQDVRRRHMVALRNDLMKQGLSAQSVRNVLSYVSAMFSDAVEDEVAEINPAFKVKVAANDSRITAKPPRKHMILTYGEMLQVAKHAPVAYRAAVLFSGATGARPSEALPRKYDDIDRDNGLVRIDTTADRGRILEGTKTDHGDPAPGRWTITTPELLEFIDAAPRSLNGFLFPTARGKVWWLENFRNRVFQPAAVSAGFGTFKHPERAAGKRGYDGLVPYDLRHSFVSLMQEAGVPVADLAKRTGHTRISTLQDTYTHALGRSDEAMKAVLSA